jgi:tetratricopeptide (TPR) repeat protein
MKQIISKFLLLPLTLFFSLPIAAQDVYLSGDENKQNYYKTAADSAANNNFSPQSNGKSSIGKRDTRTRRNENYSDAQTSADGTGEYFLVPAIVRKDPKGTAIRMNSCGAAILSLLDKNALGSLTDGETQPLTKNIVLQIAESRFRMAIKYQPNNYLYYTNLASALYRQGKIDEASEAINRAIELNPNDEVSKNYQETITRVKVEVRVLDDESVVDK